MLIYDHPSETVLCDMGVVIFGLDGMYELFNIMVTSFDVQDVKRVCFHVVD